MQNTKSNQRSLILLCSYALSLAIVLMAFQIPLPSKTTIAQKPELDLFEPEYEQMQRQIFKKPEVSVLPDKTDHPNPDLRERDNDVSPPLETHGKEKDPFKSLGKPKEDLPKEKVMGPDLGSMASFPASYYGGTKALTVYLKRNLEYPQMLRELGISGLVVFDLIIGKSGEVEELILVKGVHPAANQDVRLTLSRIKGFKAAQSFGEPVRDTIRIPVHYVLKR